MTEHVQTPQDLEKLHASEYRRLYKKPLYDVRAIRDLRDMLRQSVDLYGEHAAYLLKDPIATRQIQLRSPEHLALRVDHSRPYRPVSFRQFAADVNAMGTALVNSDFPVGSRVALVSETRYEWYVSYLSVVNGYGIVVPLDKELPDDELASLLQRSEADIVIYSAGKRKAIQAVRDKLPKVKGFIAMDLPEDEAKEIYFWDLIQKGEQRLKAGESSYTSLPIDDRAMQILLFTSGTTAKSKAVMLSHHNICTNLMAMCSMVYIDDKDVFLSVLPIHHTYECTCGYLCQLYRGSTVAVCEGLRYIVQNMKEVRATMILVVPLMLEAFYRQIMKKVSADPKVFRKFKMGLKISALLRKLGMDRRRKLFAQIHEGFGGHLRLLIAGGAAISKDILGGMQELGFNCIQGYGVTECAPIFALNRDFYYKNTAAGLPMPGVEMKIINADEDGIGEIIGRGDNVMLGYYQAEALTAEAIDAEGYYHTGDYGYIDEDGFVIITGRKSNLIVTKNGKNVFPEELEFLIAQDMRVKEVVVYADKDEGGDTLIACQIYPNDETFKEANAGSLPERSEIEKELEAWVREVNQKLVAYKRIKKITFRDTEFVKTTTRKIRRSSVIR